MKLNTKYLFLTIAIGLCITSFSFHFLSYFPTLRTSKSHIIILLSVAIFPSFIAGIKSTQKLVDKNDPTTFWKFALEGTPFYLKIILGLTVPYVFFNFFYSLVYLTGGLSPEMTNDIYVLTSKGNVIREISQTQYFEYMAYEFRGMSGHFVLFQLIAIALLSSAINLEKNVAKQGLKHNAGSSVIFVLILDSRTSNLRSDSLLEDKLTVKSEI